jgi:ferritin-like metal-binding protein YciE
MPALKSAFQYYLEKTRIQVWRLNQVFATMGVWPERYPQPRAGRPVGAGASKPEASEPTDAALTTAVRQNERHVISGYLMALNCAEILRDRAASDLLEQTLNEEYEADQIFTELSHPDPLTVAVV